MESRINAIVSVVALCVVAFFMLAIWAKHHPELDYWLGMMLPIFFFGGIGLYIFLRMQQAERRRRPQLDSEDMYRSIDRKKPFSVEDSVDTIRGQLEDRSTKSRRRRD